MRDAHIGIVGPTGAGKTTLAQVMAARSKELFQEDKKAVNVLLKHNVTIDDFDRIGAFCDKTNFHGDQLDAFLYAAHKALIEGKFRI